MHIRRHYYALKLRSSARNTSLYITALLVCFLFTILLFKLDQRWCVDIDNGAVRLDSICHESSKPCYNIYLSKGVNKNEESVVIRSLVRGTDLHTPSTIIRLRPSAGKDLRSINFRCVDSNSWLIDRSFFPSSYIAGMVALSFLMSSLSLTSDDIGKEMLVIGLGGGSLNMALNHMKPHINITVIELDELMIHIAFKWFGVVNSKNHRVVAGDGVKFIKTASAEGRKYDVVAIDACTEASFFCPVQPLRNSSALKAVRNILTSNGTLVINIAALLEQKDVMFEYIKLLEQLKSLFPTCMKMEFRDEYNIVIACVPFSVTARRKHLLNSRLSIVMSKLKLKDSIDLSSFQVIN